MKKITAQDIRDIQTEILRKTNKKDTTQLDKLMNSVLESDADDIWRNTTKEIVKALILTAREKNIKDKEILIKSQTMTIKEVLEFLSSTQDFDADEEIASGFKLLEKYRTSAIPSLYFSNFLKEVPFVINSMK